MSTLLVVGGYNIGVCYRLSESVQIGRSPENDIQLMDRVISRRHCLIEQSGDRWLIKDLESSHGVKVNGQQIAEPVELSKNDIIELGKVVFVFDADYRVAITRIGDKAVILGGLSEATAITWSSDVSRLPRVDPPNALATLKNELAEATAEATEDWSEILGMTLRRVIGAFRAQRGVIFLRGPTEGEVIPLIAVAERHAMPVCLSVVQAVIGRRQAMLRRDVQVNENLAVSMELMEHGRRSLLCVPVLYQGEVAGALYLDHQESETFTPEDAAHLQTVSHLLAPLIRRFMARGEQPAKKPPETLFLAESPAMKKLMTRVEQVAQQQGLVWIQGEAGVGKKHLVRELHQSGPRRNFPLVALNCAFAASGGAPDVLFERELFGYEKGAFNEAGSLNRGKLELAHGGMLLLEEVTELSERLQTQLLRFLQDGAFNRVGGGKPLQVDVRIIATTSLEVDEEGGPLLAPEDEFSWELFARLNPAQLSIPPLRERPEDILALTDYFLKRYNRERTQPILGLEEAARKALCDYAWPGNVRELANCLERAVMLCKDQVIRVEDLPLFSHADAKESPGHYSGQDQSGQLLPLKEMERRHILAALQHNAWNQVQAARALQIHRNTLRRKIQEYELIPE